MRDALSWSLPLGRWMGVQVRLHVLFLLFGVFAIAGCLRSSDKDLLGYGLMTLGVLFVSVVVHEAAHCAAAFSISSSVSRIVLWPFGGLEPIATTRDSNRELWMGLSGPLANLVLCGMLTPAVVISGGNPFSLLNPLEPPSGVEGFSLASVTGISLWVNWVLFTVNLLPAHPLDGARILTALLSIRFDMRSSVTILSRVAQSTAILICILGVALFDIYPFAWAPLVVFGAFLFFSAKQELARFNGEWAATSGLGYDFSADATGLNKAFKPVGSRRAGYVRSWIAQRRDARQKRRFAVEQEEDLQVDVILTRVHEHGLNGLTRAERSLLNRASQRYRKRQRQ